MAGLERVHNSYRTVLPRPRLRRAPCFTSWPRSRRAVRSEIPAISAYSLAVTPPCCASHCLRAGALSPDLAAASPVASKGRNVTTKVREPLSDCGSALPVYAHPCFRLGSRLDPALCHRTFPWSRCVDILYTSPETVQEPFRYPLGPLGQECVGAFTRNGAAWSRPDLPLKPPVLVHHRCQVRLPRPVTANRGDGHEQEAGLPEDVERFADCSADLLW